MALAMGPDGGNQRRAEMRVVKLIILNWLLGAAIGAGFAFLVIWFDLGGAGRLILKADPIWPPLALLFGGFAITFGALAAGTAIMLVPRDEDPPQGPRGGLPAPVPVPALARAGRRR